MKHRQNHHAPLLSLQPYPIILFPLCNPKVTLTPQGVLLPWQGCVRSLQRAEFRLPHPAQSNKPFWVYLERALGGIAAPVLSSGEGKKVDTCPGLAPAKSGEVARTGISPMSPNMKVWTESIPSLFLAFSSSHAYVCLCK